MAQHEQRPIVALIYDFDGTLSPGNMQEYDFIPAVGKSNREFWEESNETAREQDGDPILAYMYRMLHEAKVPASRCATKLSCSRARVSGCTTECANGFRGSMPTVHRKGLKSIILSTRPACAK